MMEPSRTCKHTSMDELRLRYLQSHNGGSEGGKLYVTLEDPALP